MCFDKCTLVTVHRWHEQGWHEKAEGGVGNLPGHKAMPYKEHVAVDESM